MTDPDEAEALAVVAQRLRDRFPLILAETVDAVVSRYHRDYDGLPIRTFVPLLVEREARDDLRRHVPRQLSGADVPESTSSAVEA